MPASTEEEIVAQHAAALRLVEACMPCADRQFLGRPAENLSQLETESTQQSLVGEGDPAAR